MKTFATQTTSHELQIIKEQCIKIMQQNPSESIKVTIVFKDRTGKTLTLQVPNDPWILEQLPQWGSYFNWII